MGKCQVCHRDSKIHSEKTWLLHQQKQRCTFCGENREKHSEKLWNIHEETVPKNAKLATILLGRGPKVLAKIEKWNTVKVNGRDSPYHLEYIPIYMLCSECGTTLGNTEEKLADVFDRTCLECFCNMTEQEYKWYESPRI